MKKKFYFDNILSKIQELPLWVKQAFYVELREHIKAETPYESLENISKQNLIQLYIPGITSDGINALKNKEIESTLGKGPITQEMRDLLFNAEQKYRIIDICQTNNWTLSKCARIITDCIEHNFIEPIYSDYISSTLFFLANKIRIGEYLVRTGKITVEQLDMALYSQKYTEDSLGDRIFLAQILLNLRYISPKDYENIIFLKDYGEELYNLDEEENIAEIDSDVNKLKSELINLRSERIKLRHNITKFSDDAITIAKLLNKIDNLKNDYDELQQDYDNCKNELTFYVDEMVSLSQENVTLKEKIQKID